ncbi:MAG: hypothetical protein AAFN93_03205 [Bacteroidota bacterium]
MKELIAKELLFFFIALIIAVPVAIFFVYLMNLQPAQGNLSTEEQVFEMQFLIIGAILGFIGVYLARLVVWAAKTVASN